MAADELLAERVLAGDASAKRYLVHQIYRPLAEAGGDLIETAIAFFANNYSVEGTARQLFVHANTVRYRLKKIGEVSGFSPTEARPAFVLQLALTLGALAKKD